VQPARAARAAASVSRRARSALEHAKVTP
jgi:hypothetical protein